MMKKHKKYEIKQDIVIVAQKIAILTIIDYVEYVVIKYYMEVMKVLVVKEIVDMLEI